MNGHAGDTLGGGLLVPSFLSAGIIIDLGVKMEELRSKRRAVGEPRPQRQLAKVCGVCSFRKE